MSDRIEHVKKAFRDRLSGPGSILIPMFVSEQVLCRHHDFNRYGWSVPNRVYVGSLDATQHTVLVAPDVIVAQCAHLNDDEFSSYVRATILYVTFIHAYVAKEMSARDARRSAMADMIRQHTTLYRILKEVHSSVLG